jgi:hypothetical protein
VTIIKEFISLRSSYKDDQNDNGISQNVVAYLFGHDDDYEDKIFKNRDSAFCLLHLLSKDCVRSLMTTSDIENAIQFLTRTVEFCNAVDKFEPYKAILDMSFINRAGLNHLPRVMRLEKEYLNMVKVAKYEKELERISPAF